MKTGPRAQEGTQVRDAILEELVSELPLPQVGRKSQAWVVIGKEDEEKPVKLRQPQRLGQEEGLVPSFTPLSGLT